MKILFNTTFILEQGRECEFLEYMRTRYIPYLFVMNGVTSPLLAKISSQEASEGHLSYALQFVVASRNVWESEVSKGLSPYIEELLKTFGSDLTGFSTIMDIIPMVDRTS